MVKGESPGVVKERIGNGRQDTPRRFEDLDSVARDVRNPCIPRERIEGFGIGSFRPRIRNTIEEEAWSHLLGKTDKCRSGIIGPNIRDDNVTSFQGSDSIRCRDACRHNRHAIGIGIDRHGTAVCIDDEGGASHDRDARQPVDRADRSVDRFDGVCCTTSCKQRKERDDEDQHEESYASYHGQAALLSQGHPPV